jgi:hypothetical protein
MHSIQLSMAAPPECGCPGPMNNLKRNRRRSWRSRYQVWKADLTLRHGWFRVLLHVLGMARCPRNIPWHWRHIVHEFHDH